MILHLHQLHELLNLIVCQHRWSTTRAIFTITKEQKFVHLAVSHRSGSRVVGIEAVAMARFIVLLTPENVLGFHLQWNLRMQNAPWQRPCDTLPLALLSSINVRKFEESGTLTQAFFWLVCCESNFSVKWVFNWIHTISRKMIVQGVGLKFFVDVCLELR